MDITEIITKCVCFVIVAGAFFGLNAIIGWIYHGTVTDVSIMESLLVGSVSGLLLNQK